MKMKNRTPAHRAITSYRNNLNTLKVAISRSSFQKELNDIWETYALSSPHARSMWKWPRTGTTLKIQSDFFREHFEKDDEARETVLSITASLQKRINDLRKASGLAQHFNPFIWEYLIDETIDAPPFNWEIFTDKPKEEAESICVRIYGRLSPLEKKLLFGLLETEQDFTSPAVYKKRPTYYGNVDTILRTVGEGRERQRPHSTEEYWGYLKMVKEQVSDKKFKELKKLRPNEIRKSRKGKTSNDIAKSVFGPRAKSSSIRKIISRNKNMLD